MRLVPTGRKAKIVSIDSGAHRDRVLAARDALVTDHLHLVPPIARHIRQTLPPAFELDDLIAAGNLALVHAATRFRPRRYAGVPFAAFASSRVRCGIIDSIRRKNYEQTTRPPIPEGMRGELPYFPDHIEGIDRRSLDVSLAHAMEALSPRQQDVVRAFYVEGHTRPVVAAALGLSKHLVDRERDSAIAELRRRLRWAGITA